jgi:hypothetical protein
MDIGSHGVSSRRNEARFGVLINRNERERGSAQGVTVVVNLRTPEEMADREAVPFDEEEVVRKAGMDYVESR